MEEYYWDSQLEYLQNTRDLYYNDDYLEFLVSSVWKISKPVHIIDYGCGYGYLGLKLLPLLPKGSIYKGIDKGEQLIDKAKNLFKNLPYETEFTATDVTEMNINREYDIAICHAFLLHMTNPKKILQKMINSVFNEGRIICFEPHWVSNMSSLYLHEYDQSEIMQLGFLQKLFENDTKRNGKDGNIGIKLPAYLSELGVTNIDCRISDKVNFLDTHINHTNKQSLFDSLKEEGLGIAPGEKEEFIETLMKRDASFSEAQAQYEAELRFSRLFNMDSSLTYAPNMKITSGVIKR
ncbi:methyltransferase domain-containing protein [Chengkuizengella axinellae]|uniref:Methyltransferase domain-containing protein n=1 Tax=Chengkuizengella axinellae TaxID=3064388 RepID=A0ABT9J450_9BACL|nr:methyltransferase domain-containing protein [Chengkuizengella sp. 2205SS18-9]MDP5276369.1 methyltransferase domain-containing protein [Chengkuizengella sp. 2205SS18-9]